MSEAMIRFDGVYKRYEDGYEAIRGVTLGISQGEMVFVMGHSGAGKSTLLRMMAAIERPSRGSVVVNGQNITAMRRHALPFLRRNLGMIFQDHKLLFERTVLENALLPLQITGNDPRESLKRARAALDKVGLLEREKLHPISLSGGEQQRLCIARAIVNRPAILIADEPTGNLDHEYANEIMDMFKSFNQVGVTVIIATHDETMLHRYQPRLIQLRQGQIVAGNEVAA